LIKSEDCRSGRGKFQAEDRSEDHALTNLIGNGVATVAIGRREGEVTKETLREKMFS